LLHILDEEELYGVLARQFGHVRNRHIRITSVVAALAGAIALIANVAQWGLIFGGYGGRNERDQGAGGAIVEERIRRLEAMAGGIRHAS
jgi:heat shock protein HtpX